MNRFPRIIVLAALLMGSAASTAGRLADVGIYDRTARRELPVHWHEGQAYVVGEPGSEFEVVVRNRTQEDLLAVASIDGVNAVTGESASTQQSGYVVSRLGRARIAGWRKSLDETAAFYFTALHDSYAARTGRPDHVGVIGVALSQRRQEITQAPASAAAPSASLGTGHGRRETSHAQHVTFERRTREPAEVISIHYDSRANLVARGVLAEPYARRRPTPFPGGFVPDP